MSTLPDDPSTPQYGRTPLHMAEANGHTELVRYVSMLAGR